MSIVNLGDFGEIKHGNIKDNQDQMLKLEN